LFAVSELLLDRPDTIIAVAAAVLKRRLVEIIVQRFPATGGALAVKHDLREFIVFLFVSLFALLGDLVEFAATKICLYEIEPRIATSPTTHRPVRRPFEQCQADPNLGFFSS